MQSQIICANAEPGQVVHRRMTPQKLMLVCGVLSSLLYIGMDVFASMQWEGYSYTAQAFSELLAVEAPTRSLMVFGSLLPYNVLVLIFAAGVWAAADDKHLLHIVAALLAVHAIAGVTGGLIFPMHVRGQEAMTFTDIMHIISTVVELLAILLFIIMGAVASGKWFRLYSVGTLLIFVLGGAIAFTAAPRMAAGLPTPGMGITERLNIYASMLWVAVLAVMLLGRQSNTPSLENGAAVHPVG